MVVWLIVIHEPHMEIMRLTSESMFTDTRSTAECTAVRLCG